MDISSVNCTDMAGDQDNLHMKFSALNVDFSGLGLNLLHSTRPAHTDVKRWVPL